ncbi:MAG: hypothetical protein RLZZ396_1021 [Planctomycetota bacterium]|jgi:hypothetical protein
MIWLAPKGLEEIAQGNALGLQTNKAPSPERAKWVMLPRPHILPFQGLDRLFCQHTQGVALGYLMKPLWGISNTSD